MQIKTYHLDAFTQNLFSGNPAMVCILEQWLPDTLLQSIAAENYLPATVFLVREKGKFFIRWFTPEYEIDLCGHGTLACGQVIFSFIDSSLQEAELHSPAGILIVKRKGDMISLDLPVKQFVPCATPQLLTEGLNLRPQQTYQYLKERCLAVFQSEEEVRQVQPRMDVLKQLGYRGIIVTAPGKGCDFVSRVFYPNKLLSEDAVTGSSHCLLVPYWAERLNKLELHSRQLSHRGGELLCQLAGERVILQGRAVVYMEGSIVLSALSQAEQKVNDRFLT